jgi:hypothetical protein
MLEAFGINMVDAIDEFPYLAYGSLLFSGNPTVETFQPISSTTEVM